MRIKVAEVKRNKTDGFWEKHWVEKIITIEDKEIYRYWYALNRLDDQDSREYVKAVSSTFWRGLIIFFLSEGWIEDDIVEENLDRFRTIKELPTDGRIKTAEWERWLLIEHEI
ncbi:MAG: hypothetical protein NC915_06790, partial [Candidatus Omnitrophica bacterium]|nr:hypothetical protein [Candidatus Omnitrophota bacterium]